MAQEKRNYPQVQARFLLLRRLVAQGRSNKELAEELGITEMTVRTHVSNTLAKLHLASRPQAALYAPRERIASLDKGAAMSER